MIGVGDRGNDLLDQIVKVPNVELVAMADIYSRRRDQAKSKVPSIQTFDDYRRLLDMKDIDGVIVASPLHIHVRHFIDTLAAGKDLYAEKTMTWSIPEADKCLSAAKGSDRVVQIGLQHVSPLLHTPLMSLTNALDAIAVVGAIVLVGEKKAPYATVLGVIAIVAATSNVVGGFFITDRMLRMFKTSRTNKPQVTKP